ncbi:hypothetical protein EDB87DRAFT_1589656 [Lactarius vividus]|nr:hypothetical protein EDB87DRAFT_1589656 [Lactarius vividus]
MTKLGRWWVLAMLLVPINRACVYYLRLSSRPVGRSVSGASVRIVWYISPMWTCQRPEVCLQPTSKVSEFGPQSMIPPDILKHTRLPSMEIQIRTCASLSSFKFRAHIHLYQRT